jgi:hypothetical protein
LGCSGSLINADLDVVVICTVTVAGFVPFSVAGDGVTVHVAMAGAPVHVKVTL